jgi:short subunit dehydrogenase-like uncharacterized protein
MSPEQIIEKWVAAARAGTDTNNLEVGVDISPLPAVKIAFDGYAEDDDGIEDLDRESYAVYIHRDAATAGFTFPEHQRTAWAIVQRSNALSHHAYSRDFRYDEAVTTGKGLRGRLAAMATTAGLGVFMVASALGPTRALLERFVLPKPGEGPSPEAQRRGFFDLRFLGRTDDGRTLRVKVTGDRDPGYGSTAKMLGESAACLALDMPSATLAGGFWTPATAFGERLVSRLQARAGLTFEVID